MKRKLPLIIAATLLVSGCSFLDKVFDSLEESLIEQKKEEKTQNTSTNTDTTDNNQQQNQNTPTENVPKTKVGEFYGGVVSNKDYVGYEFSKYSKEIKKPTTGIGTVNIYAFNDFHGAVLQTNNEAGLKSIGTYFKEISQDDNTLILDQGDTWQGSLESNYEYGAVVQDVFNYAGVSLRTVGNHDFDWGVDHLESTQNRKIGDDYIPVLAANVYDYANGVNGKTQQNKYGKEYATFILDNGIKVGVVGVIGSSQITSICSALVQDICFTDHISKAKEISDYLRTKKDCDIVIVSAHEGTSDMVGQGLDEISSVSNKRYADLVLSGHKHYQQSQTINGVKYVQWDSNGESTGKIELKYNFDSGEVLDSETQVTTQDVNFFLANYSTIDSTIEKMVNDSLEKTNPLAEEVLSTNFSGFFKTEALGYLMTEAIYNAVSGAGRNIDFAVCNYARTSFNKTTLTYGDLYKCFPFDNKIILMDISSNAAINSLSHNMTYREDTSLIPASSNSYKVAVIDYVALHQNIYRNYDYFPEASTHDVFSVDEESEPIIYREILANYLRNNPTKAFASSSYQSSQPHFSLS